MISNRRKKTKTFFFYFNFYLSSSSIHTQVDIGTNYNNLSLSDIFDYRKLPKENIREKVALFLLELTGKTKRDYLNKKKFILILDKLLELNTDDSKSLLLICKVNETLNDFILKN
jgi:hypothetical protein